MFWDLLFDAPEPRKIASLPVSWIASTIADGAAGGVEMKGQLPCPHPSWMFTSKEKDGVHDNGGKCWTYRNLPLISTGLSSSLPPS